MIYFFPDSLAMVLGSWKDDGTYSQDSWPSDAVEMTQKEEEMYWLQTPPIGKAIGVTEDNRPIWVDVQRPSVEALASSALSERDRLLQLAAVRIDPLQDAVDLGLATSDEVIALRKWKRYRVALNRIEDQLYFPLSIEWPEV